MSISSYIWEVLGGASTNIILNSLEKLELKKQFCKWVVAVALYFFQNYRVDVNVCAIWRMLASA